MVTPDPFDATVSRAAQEWSLPSTTAQVDALTRYASLLLTWTARINLTGAVSLDDLAAEHLPDAFALASRLSGAGRIDAVDVGSGGGLPALPLAILCPNLTFQLVEPVAKKAAFLRTAVRELELSARVTIAIKRAEVLVPAAFDVAISRATLPPPAWIALGAQLVRPGGRIFVLASAASDPGPPPAPLELIGRWPYLGQRRTLLELRRPIL
jgi:16S rRNA (guanine527-N7)-methyltransferase